MSKLIEAYNHFKKRYNETDRDGDENAFFWSCCIMAEIALENYYDKWQSFWNLSELSTKGEEENK